MFDIHFILGFEFILRDQRIFAIKYPRFFQPYILLFYKKDSDVELKIERISNAFYLNGRRAYDSNGNDEA